MKIIIAPDSFKGNMSSIEVGEIIKKALLAEIPDAEILCIPMADGGEGTVAAAVAATGGEMAECEAVNALGDKIKTFYGLSGDGRRAVIEMAAASGIELLESNRLNPLKATTFGTGQLIRDALDRGVRDFLIGIGGSATNDAGAGMAQALGFEFFDANGQRLEPGIGGSDLNRVASVGTDKVDKRLAQCIINVACDVENPLLGTDGASHVYGPQKGADAAEVELLDANLRHFSQLLIAAGLADDCVHPGDGAAGGLGFALRNLLKAQVSSGAELMMQFNDFERHLADADFMISGEGRTDSQSVCGKLCCQLAQAARRHGVCTILMSGALDGDMHGLRKYFDAMFSISMGVCTLEEAIANSPDNLYWTARSAGALIKKRIQGV